MSDLLKLSKPFPAKLVKKPPKGKYGSYVKHSTIAEALLATVGAYDLEVKMVIRGDVAGFERTNKDTGEVKVFPNLDRVIVGVVAALTLQVDGRDVTVEEAGDCDDPHNWTHDGQRLKDAVSDAVKRCAMRFGLGLHLWSQENYFLHGSLSKKEASSEEAPSGPSPDVETRPAATEAERPAAADREVQETPPLSTGPDVEAEIQRMTEAISKSTKNGKTKVEKQENGGGDSGNGHPSPVLTAKRAHFRSICKKANVDPDECAAEIGAISLEKASLEQVEALISQRGA